MDEVQIGSAGGRPLQRKRIRTRGWNQKKRAQFLDMLAFTCNVRLACAETGMAASSAYLLRRTDPEFAELWRAALLAGYERLETELLQRALQSVNAIAPGDGGEEVAAAGDALIEKMDVKTILQVLARRGTTDGGTRAARRDPRGRVATEEETDAALLKKLAVLEKQVRDRA